MTHSRRLHWRDLGTSDADGANDNVVEIEGVPASAFPGTALRHFVLLSEATCCPGCVPRDPLAAIEVFAASSIPLRGQSLRLVGTWRVRADHDGAWRYHLHDARPVQPAGWASVSRRGVLTAGPLMCLTACAATPAQRGDAARRAIEAGPAIDIHTHAGGIASVARMTTGIGFGAIGAPMREGGMAAVCLAVVSDGPTHRVNGDGRIHPYRDPAMGELYQYGQTAFARVHALAKTQGLTVITDRAGLRAAKAGTASFIMTAEGADFLEGNVDRVDEAFSRWSLRQLQLTHYRVNELGDIQTESPVHGGLTDIGAAVIQRCNRLGIVVDVAHGTYDLVVRAASVTTKPLVLSHTSLTTAPGRFSRQISSAHARIIAATGGVIGVWPPQSIYPSLTAMATGIARLADVVGVDHVGIGSDMRGLTGPSVFPDYATLPALAEALIEVGFAAADATKILGGNYVRVFEASMA